MLHDRVVPRAGLRYQTVCTGVHTLTLARVDDDDGRVSRRALFSLGRARVAPAPPRPPAASRPSEEHRPRAAPASWDGCRGLELWAPASAAVVELAAVTSRDRVLDAGCGDGNVTLAAAALGARVIACDTSRELLVRGAQRAAAAGVHASWQHADLTALPFGDGAYDATLSAFAPMFCHPAEDALSELARVTRHGGSIAVAAWSAEGAVGELLRLAAAIAPPPPGVPAPFTWGHDAALGRALERAAGARALLEERTLQLRFATPATAAAALTAALAPLRAAAAAHPALAAELERAVAARAAPDPEGIALPAAYLLAVAPSTLTPPTPA